MFLSIHPAMLLFNEKGGHEYVHKNDVVTVSYTQESSGNVKTISGRIVAFSENSSLVLDTSERFCGMPLTKISFSVIRDLILIKGINRLGERDIYATK